MTDDPVPLPDDETIDAHVERFTEDVWVRPMFQVIPQFEGWLHAASWPTPMMHQDIETWSDD